jgi:hypothetical protein
MAVRFGKNDAGKPIQDCPRENRQAYWIEIELLDEKDGPIPWQEFRLISGAGETIKGFLDDRGWSRVENLDEGGDYRIGFPALDKDAWEFVESLPAREDDDGEPA